MRPEFVQLRNGEYDCIDVEKITSVRHDGYIMLGTVYHHWPLTEEATKNLFLVIAGSRATNVEVANLLVKEAFDYNGTNFYLISQKLRSMLAVGELESKGHDLRNAIVNDDNKRYFLRNPLFLATARDDRSRWVTEMVEIMNALRLEIFPEFDEFTADFLL